MFKLNNPSITQKENLMLIELITPLMIATAPVTIDVVTLTYNHQTQTTQMPDGQIGTGPYRTNTSTFNGTQTFDFQGRPKDADSDSDSD